MLHSLQMSLKRVYREDYFLKINSRTCMVIKDIRVNVKAVV